MGTFRSSPRRNDAPDSPKDGDRVPKKYPPRMGVGVSRANAVPTWKDGFPRRYIGFVTLLGWTELLDG